MSRFSIRRAGRRGWLAGCVLLAGAAVGLTAQSANAAVAIVVDAQANRKPISPLIYGVAFAANSNQLADLNCPLHRSGGNNETRYNWQINAHNLDADWYFESYPDSSPAPGETADSFVANSKSGGAQPMITVPMIGWAPKLGPGRTILWSYSVAKYGPQASTDPYLGDAGNGKSSTNGNACITCNNPNDANFPTNTAFEQGYVQHLLQRWGPSTNGGVRYYIMDNEHSIWFSTHQDVHPVGPTMQEIWGKMLATASMVKSNDPNALVLGPEEWGWCGYFDSGYDQQWSGQHGDYNPAHYPDRAVNGGWDYMPWLLNQFHQHDTNTGQRLLDCLTLHCYPQENGVGGSDASPATALLRNQSTRQFWDSKYVDPSWINSVIMLIPRMRNWVSAYYPGTKIGITEYNWGAEADINGAAAQADLLGIFGREGLDLATRWTAPGPGTPVYNAMKMYRNYDGNKSTFGDTSVSVTGPNPDEVSTFAALRSSDGALTAMVINKQLTASATASVTLTNFLPAGVARVWQLTASNVITRLPDLSFAGSAYSSTVPPQSITLFVLPAGAPVAPRLSASVMCPANTCDFCLDGQAGQSYIVLCSSNLLNWLPLWTNTLASNSCHIAVSATNAPWRFFRAQWTP
ncbi:MAG: glycoside hydrolase family 44 protein [Limisphaerales bacterium]